MKEDPLMDAPASVRNARDLIRRVQKGLGNGFDVFSLDVAQRAVREYMQQYWEQKERDKQTI